MLVPTRATLPPTITATASPSDSAPDPQDVEAVHADFSIARKHYEQRAHCMRQFRAPLLPPKAFNDPAEPSHNIVVAPKPVYEQQLDFTFPFLRSNLKTFTQLHDLLVSYPYAREIYLAEPASLLQPLEQKITGFRALLKEQYGAQAFPRWSSDCVEGWREAFATISAPAGIEEKGREERRVDPMAALEARVQIEQHIQRQQEDATPPDPVSAESRKRKCIHDDHEEERKERAKKIDSGHSGADSKRCSVESAAATPPTAEITCPSWGERERITVWRTGVMQEGVNEGSRQGADGAAVQVQVPGAAQARNPHDQLDVRSRENLTPRERWMRNRDEAWVVDVGGFDGPPWRELSVGGTPVSLERGVWERMNGRAAARSA